MGEGRFSLLWGLLKTEQEGSAGERWVRDESVYSGDF